MQTLKICLGIAVAGLGASFSGALVSGSAEAAQRVCGERAKMTKFLTARYKETPRAVGVSTSGKSVMEIYTSENGTWTVLLTTARGKTCIMGAGHSWQDKDKLAYLPKT